MIILIVRKALVPFSFANLQKFKIRQTFIYIENVGDLGYYSFENFFIQHRFLLAVVILLLFR
jgi:hypothetical protein